MRFFRGVLPNLSISLNLALMVVIYLDMRNPMMGFLVGAPFVVLAACACVSSVISAAILYGSYRNNNNHARNQQKNMD